MRTEPCFSLEFDLLAYHFWCNGRDRVAYRGTRSRASRLIERDTLYMDLEKFTERSRGFLQAASTIAIREFHQRITPEHLLKALLDDEEGAAAGLIRAAEGDPQAAKQAVDLEVSKLPKVQGGRRRSAAGDAEVGPGLGRGGASGAEGWGRVCGAGSSARCACRRGRRRGSRPPQLRRHPAGPGEGAR